MSEPVDEARDESFLNGGEERTLLEIARRAVEEWVREGQRTDWLAFDLTQTLHQVCGCFVTVRVNGKLRGCIGSTAHIDPLAKSVRDNAISAASRDPRFEAIQQHELGALTLEISALMQGDEPGTPFRRVRDIAEIQIGRDGICIQARAKRGLLLPQVATERNWNREQFLAATCMKAGLDKSAWRERDVVLYRFSAQVFGDG